MTVARTVLAMMPNYLLQNPDDARARMFYAVTLCDVGQPDAALLEGQAAIDASPGDSVMLYNAACLYARAWRNAARGRYAATGHRRRRRVTSHG